MIIEISINKKLYDKNELTKLFDLASEDFIDMIVTPFFYLQYTEYIQTPKIGIYIDYPFGLSDRSAREQEIIRAIKKGACCLDVCINSNLIHENRFIEIIEEFQIYKKICNNSNVILRPVIEPKDLYYKDIIFLSQLLAKEEFTTIVLSTMLYFEEPVDNLILAGNLEQSSIQSIVCANFNSEHQFNLIKNAGIYGIRSSSYNFLSKIKKMVYNN